MTTPQWASPSKEFRDGPGNTFEWKLGGQWRRFRILQSDVDAPEAPLMNLIGYTELEDHLEELFQLNNKFYRYAGGGRGFYWWDELQLIGVVVERRSKR